VLARTSDTYQVNLIDRLLDDVDLLNRADRKVGDYSTGMKQRLGIAAVLVNDPELVILDEPTNGLDPAGIQEMRAFIRQLAEHQNKTVFLSSHLLSEVEQVCDQVAIISKGKLLQHGSVDELLSSGGQKLQIQVSPSDRAIDTLKPQWACNLQSAPGDDKVWIEVHAEAHESPLLVELLVQQGVRVFQVIARRRSLEEFFMSVTSDSERTEV
jgi:ABC-2 type transport system ATP-binding protein